ncbi:arpin [Biomphalaria glabrata]|uniref:Arpin n=1 Tax=Biomphalaria glabrata TaxID=6526 RepID=A0A2C9L9Y7_BIOGL|nr:arpin-like isoform X2 [Biomphalaria glabrata]KAI8746807.1 arpin-like [Biomphalaria glabrata]KAI8788498.1 arpin [Biomphalaria glabrata]
MSRLYDNKPLDNLPVQNVKWNGAWSHLAFPKSSKENPGVLCEGKVISQARISITSSDSSVTTKGRYFVLFLEIEKAHRRKFDEEGKEIEPNFSETTKVSTGYLNSSYDVKSKGQTDKLSLGQVKSFIHNSNIEDMLKDLVTKSYGDLFLLFKEEDREKIELTNGMSVRIKTLGDSPIVESLVIHDEVNLAVKNFVGDDKIGSNWTDKIMKMKGSSGVGKDNVESSEVAEEEWDD